MRTPSQDPIETKSNSDLRSNMVVLSRLGAQSRAVLTAGITVLLDADTFWFIVNCDASYGFSLCHHLGICVRDYKALLVAAQLATMESYSILKIKYTGWLAFVDTGHFVFMKEHINCDSKKRDLCAHAKGTNPIKKNIKTYRIICIGQVTDSTAGNLLDKKDEADRLVQTPPKPKQLQLQQ